MYAHKYLACKVIYSSLSNEETCNHYNLDTVPMLVTRSTERTAVFCISFSIIIESGFVKYV